MRTRLALVLVSCLGWFACKSGAGTKSVPQSSDLFSSPTEAMETYDASFRALFYRHINQEGFDHEQLKLMYNFYLRYTIWAQVLEDGKIVSMTKGTPYLVFAVYVPGHPALGQEGPTLITRPGEHVVVYIRPNRIAKDIAGIFLIHEISHGLDFINNTRVDDFAVNETKAFMHEKKAANIAYNWALDVALDKILNEIKPQDVDDLIRFRETKEGRLKMQDMLIDIEKTMIIRPPQSDADAEMRLGFYSTALEIRRQESKCMPKSKCSISAEKIGKLFKATSKY
jgi:hypothetical protein